METKLKEEFEQKLKSIEEKLSTDGLLSKDDLVDILAMSLITSEDKQ